MNPEDRAACGVMAAVLRRGHMLHLFSTPLTVASFIAIPALAVLAGPPLFTIDASVTFIAGVCEAFFAARVALDADLFGELAKGHLDLDGLDTAMDRLGLASKSKLGRPLEARVDGALRLLRLQAGWLLLQLATSVAVMALIGITALLKWHRTG
ncbi:MAG: hypothetical protein ACHQAQ_02695 [Hyphomicrobiales bacterium]